MASQGNVLSPVPSGSGGDINSPAWQQWLTKLAATVNAIALGTVGDAGTVVGVLAGQITVINGQIITINGQITTINGQISTIGGQIVTLNMEAAYLLAKYTTQVVAPVTGFSQLIAANTGLLLLTPAGVLATGTISMPTAPANGFEVQIASTQTVTALTVLPSAGQTIIGTAATNLAPSLQLVYRWIAATNSWYRLQ